LLIGKKTAAQDGLPSRKQLVVARNNISEPRPIDAMHRKLDEFLKS
jgi:hypothetical protein